MFLMEFGDFLINSVVYLVMYEIHSIFSDCNKKSANVLCLALELFCKCFVAMVLCVHSFFVVSRTHTVFLFKTFAEIAGIIHTYTI